jgi:hypothetical protein
MTSVKKNVEPGEVKVIDDYVPEKKPAKQLDEADLLLFKKKLAVKQQPMLAELAKRNKDLSLDERLSQFGPAMHGGEFKL